MKFRKLLSAGALALAALTGTVRAESPVTELKAPARPRSASWFGLTTGLVAGSVEIDCSPQNSGGDCDESGVFQTYGFNFTVAGRSALRLRLQQAQENTDHKPYEAALLLGTRLGRSHWYGLAGVGRIGNPDDDYPGGVTGLAWEFLYARPSADGVGFEFSVQGNNFGDASYVGGALGVRFGNLR